MKLTMRNTSLVKICCYLILFVLGVEFIFINATLIWLFLKIKNELAAFSELQDFSMEKVLKHFNMEKALHYGKHGGFVNIMQETIERVYMVTYPPQTKTSKEPQISFFGIDFSQNREASLLIKRINSRRNFPYKRLIVDIGANDGLLSSNSFNFIQWGWSAVLVEPQITEIQMAKVNTFRYVDPYNDKSQNVSFVRAVVGPKNGIETFVLTSKSFFSESHIYNPDERLTKKDITIQVQSYTVGEIAKMNNIPKYFGILSIDAEGSSYKILKQWLLLGYRPAYIICETIHEKPLETYYKAMVAKGYRIMSEIGWNVIFEYQEDVHDDDNEF
ncbi:uncharacterized protein LOC126823647 [Patella vulgata]|uniref:uncharacterized protein LOC126823647 n=1 Tax=Patella vulgata TaxID=6465 RepID=UPI00217F4C81|nr:uncharacterized protein LOC126823647 [Patella vulgata]